MLDIGESLVGSYLRYIEDCDFVHYETYDEGQGELDVLGMRIADKRVSCAARSMPAMGS